MLSGITKILQRRRQREPGTAPHVPVVPVMMGRGVFARQQVKYPLTLPGRFFIIVYARSAESYTLIVDDADRSSYVLGGDVPSIMRQFRIWAANMRQPRVADIGDNAVDMAHEFGKAQAIFSDGRVIPLTDKQPTKTVAGELARIEEEQDNGYTSLIHL